MKIEVKEIKMKKIITILVSFVLLISLCGCSKKGGSEEVTPEKIEHSQLLYKQSNIDIPKNYDDLNMVLAKYDEYYWTIVNKYADTDYAKNPYYQILILDVLYYDAFKILSYAQANQDRMKEEDYFYYASFFTGKWNELYEFEKDPEAFLTMTDALIKGEDYFNLTEDSVDRTDTLEKVDGYSWPKGYFFDDYVTPFDGVEKFLTCEEYLDGYGNDDAQLCLMTGDLDREASIKVAQSFKDKGFAILPGSSSDDEEGSKYYIYFGNYLNENEETIEVLMVYADNPPEPDIGLYIGEAANNRFLLLIGNFDYAAELNTAILYAFM